MDIKKLRFIEGELVFLVNFLLILLVMFFINNNWDMSYFFYLLMGVTFIFGFVFFKTSKDITKSLILTNLFIFFYFLYPFFSEFFSVFFNVGGFFFVLFYNIIIAFIFILFLGEQRNFIGDIKRTSFGILFLTLFSGIFFGGVFYLIDEPIPLELFGFVSDFDLLGFFVFVAFFSLMIAIGEQMIFTGFLYNVYSKLTSKWNAFIQVALLFSLFHALNLDKIIEHFGGDGVNSMIFIFLYFIFLFIFMLLALMLYTFRWKKYNGNFLYPVLFHFVVDFILFTLILLPYVV